MMKNPRQRLLVPKGLNSINCCEVEEHEDNQEDQLIESELLETYAPHEEPYNGPARDYIASSDGENMMEHNMKTAVETITILSLRDS